MSFLQEFWIIEGSKPEELEAIIAIGFAHLLISFTTFFLIMFIKRVTKLKGYNKIEIKFISFQNNGFFNFIKSTYLFHFDFF